ncbi:DNA-directed DNA polymerase [Kaistia sp. 32K]|uniref:Y-family DNA polymerase n=1 Tax=Kaistia sp. 32K TaxID=2795690 RepID=UPI0019362B20|nr:DNA polymerase Y family protein [Kaistia sp. 32K]BCP51587.1 DNA-directed DNA polymerase [Kaistia sp. 32K]
MKSSSSPRRYCAIRLPFLASNRLRRRPNAPHSGLPAETPLVIVEKAKGAIAIAAPDAAAIDLGLAPGLSLAEARARLSDLVVAEHDPAADDALVEAIADWCDRYTPLVARHGARGLMLDITGVAHLFKGEAALLDDLLTRLDGLGLTAFGAIAGAPATARALARSPRRTVVEPGREASAVRPLPISALGLDPARLQALARAGLKTVGDLIDRPRAPLAARFGADCVERLERLAGILEHPISPRRPVPAALAERIFFQPIAHADDIAATLARLAADVASLLETRGEGGRSFEASFYRVDGDVRRITVATARPNRAPKAIARLFHEKLDALSDPLDAGFGFDLIRLGAFRTEPFVAAQASLDGHALDDEAVADLVDRLGARFGPERVLGFVPEDTHIPERRTRMVPVFTLGAEERLNWDEMPAAGEPPLRPLSLFDPPEPVEALGEVPDGPPLSFRWRRVLHQVARAEGPERIAPEWWRDGGPDRDYFRVEDRKGARFWLYREGFYAADRPQPRWFLHGLFA